VVLLERDMEQYVALTQDLFQAENNIRTFKTLVVMDRIKTGTGVPVLASGV